MKVCDLFLGDARFISVLAPKLDIESRSIGNWRKLGGELGIHKKKLDQFGLPHHGPAAMLFCYLETADPQLNIGLLRDHLKAMERNDVIQILDKYNVNGKKAFTLLTLYAPIVISVNFLLEISTPSQSEMS